MNKMHFDDLAKRLSEALPQPLKEYQQELRNSFSRILESSLSHLNLVTRSEFEAERAALTQARAQLDVLSQRVSVLEGITNEKGEP